MKSNLAIIKNIVLCLLILSACSIHPFDLSNRLSVSDASCSAINDTLENDDNDADHEYVIQTCHAFFAFEIDTLSDNVGLMPSPVHSIFIPPQA